MASAAQPPIEPSHKQMMQQIVQEPQRMLNNLPVEKATPLQQGRSSPLFMQKQPKKEELD